jgi:hypothetical protein
MSAFGGEADMPIALPFAKNKSAEVSLLAEAMLTQ